MLFSTLLKNSTTEKSKENLFFNQQWQKGKTFYVTYGLTIYIGKQNGNKSERFWLSAYPKAIKK